MTSGEKDRTVSRETFSRGPGLPPEPHAVLKRLSCTPGSSCPGIQGKRASVTSGRACQCTVILPRAQFARIAAGGAHARLHRSEGATAFLRTSMGSPSPAGRLRLTTESWRSATVSGVDTSWRGSGIARQLLCPLTCVSLIMRSHNRRECWHSPAAAPRLSTQVRCARCANRERRVMTTGGRRPAGWFKGRT